MQKPTLSAGFLTIIFALLWSSASSSFAQLQGEGPTPLAAAQGRPAGSYQISDIENINYFSGQLNVNIPITTIGGRGSAAYPIGVHINSSNWSTSVNYIDSDPVFDILGNDFIGDLVQHNEAMMGFVDVKMRFSYEYEEDVTCHPSVSYFQSLTRIYVTMPDGTETELRDSLSDGAEGQSSECTGKTNRGKIFVSKDGSSMMFKADFDVIDNYGNSGPVWAGTLYLRDGTTYRVENGVTGAAKLKDRNGNYIAFDKAAITGNPWVKDLVYTDPNGRVTTVRQPTVSPIPQQGYVEYKGFDGETRQVLVNRVLMSEALYPGQTIQTPNEMFGTYNVNGGTGDYNPEVISEITLPNGLSYNFQYDCYGEIKRITFPTGSVIEYDWDGGLVNGNSNGIIGGASGKPIVYRRVVQRRLYENGTDLSTTVTISRPESDSPYANAGYVDVKTYGSSLLSHERHFYYGTATETFQFDLLYAKWKLGREYQTDILKPSDSTLLTRTTQTWEQNNPSWYSSYCPTCTADMAPVNHPHVTETTTTLADTNQVSKKTFNYDSNDNLTDTYEYDFGSGSPGPFLRRSHTDYLTTNSVNSADYTSDSIHILDLPSQSWISSNTNGSSKISLTKFEYDNYGSDSMHAALVDRANISGHDSAFGTNCGSRGNPTKVTSYADAQGQTGLVSTHAQYDIAGNVVKAIDSNGNASTVSYSDNFGSPDAEARTNSAPIQLNGQQTFALPSSATNPRGDTVYIQADYSTGAAVDAEDMNGNVRSMFYNDDLDRPTQMVSANNRSELRRQTSFAYDDTNRILTVTTDCKAFNDNLIKVESRHDRMGRTTETRQYETATDYIASLTEYDSLGRAFKSSNPYRPYLSEQPAYSITSFDLLGRVTQIQTPDGAAVHRSYSGTTTTVTDQAGKQRSGTTDAIGRLLKVVEDPSGLNYQTTYAYDLMGRLRKTTQTEGATIQNRYFMYNDLGRLLRAKQTEQVVNSSLNITDSVTGNTGWSVAYGYDNNGNITSTTDALNRTITGTYDNLNRLTFRDYSDSTPDVTFTFDDQNIANSKGQLTAVTSSISSTNYTSFDVLGRVTSSQQITNGQTYSFPNYTYDFSGALVSETYPSLRVVTTETDDLGRLSRVASQLPSQVQKTMLSELAYTSFGGVKQDKLGNGRWESAQFDTNRLQIKQIGLGGSAGDTSLLKIEYGYGTTNNNGALLQQKITVPGATNQIVQDYIYDSLNRLSTATETTNAVQQWEQTFTYDRFGNRRFDLNNTTTQGSFTQAQYNPNVNQATNRLNTGDGYSYDAEGNLTANPESQLFAYDSENRIKQVQNTSTQSTADYEYDGAGKRVRKVINSTQETVFIYDAFGKLVAEYTVNQTPTQNGTQYLTTDALGSPRIATGAIGQVVSRHDYMPFGEEVYAGLGGRTAAQGYGQSDNARQKFTGYERDDESGLDYAQARYFSSKNGRFTTVDPLPISASIRNPQTFNRYSYGLNSPYKFTDPLGLSPGCQGPTGGSTLSTGKSCDSTQDETPKCPVADCSGWAYDAVDHKWIPPGGVISESGGAVQRAGAGIVSGWRRTFNSIVDLPNRLVNTSKKILRGMGFDTGGKPIPSPTDTAPAPGGDAPDGGGDGTGSGSGSATEILLNIALHVAEYYIREMLSEKPLEGGKIYRPDTGQTDEAATPKPKDLNGLSATLTSCEGQPRCRVYDVATIRASGQLNVVNDHDKHVAIFPDKALDLFIWMASRGRYQHPYTRIIQKAKIQ